MGTPQRFRLVRGTVLAKIDKLMRDPTQAMLDALNAAGANLADISEGHGVTKPSERSHIIDDMLGDGWWSGPIDRKQYFIAAYRKAIELSLLENGMKVPAVTPRPIRTLWAKGTKELEISILETEHEITVIWLTQTPPKMPLPTHDPASEVEQEAIWAIAPRQYVNDVIDEFVDAGYTDFAPPEEHGNTPDVSVFQLIHY